MEEALLNQQLRETIANDSVKSLFSTFCPEDGIVLDILKAYEHVRHVLHDMRRKLRILNQDKDLDDKEKCDDTECMVLITIIINLWCGGTFYLQLTRRESNACMYV